MNILKFLTIGVFAFASVGCETYVVNVPPPQRVHYTTPTYKAPASVTPTADQTPDVVRSWE